MSACSTRRKDQLHKNIDTDSTLFLELISPYSDDVVIGVECVFCWYWLADLCASRQLSLILGHALYMRAIHRGKSKNGKIDSYKIACLLKCGNFPVVYSYPTEWWVTRDLLRRRMHICRRCDELVAHIQNTNSQYNLPGFNKKPTRKHNLDGVAEHFQDPEVRKSVEVDLEMIDSLNEIFNVAQDR